MKKIIKNTRLQLIVLAISLLITTTVLGLSAYLNDQDEFSMSFTVISKDDFQIVINGHMYNNEVVFAGSTFPDHPYNLTHRGCLTRLCFRTD